MTLFKFCPLCCQQLLIRKKFEDPLPSEDLKDPFLRNTSNHQTNVQKHFIYIVTNNLNCHSLYKQ